MSRIWPNLIGTEKQHRRQRTCQVTQEKLSCRGWGVPSLLSFSLHRFSPTHPQGILCPHPGCPRRWTFLGRGWEKSEGAEGGIGGLYECITEGSRNQLLKCTDLHGEVTVGTYDHIHNRFAQFCFSSWVRVKREWAARLDWTARFRIRKEKRKREGSEFWAVQTLRISMHALFLQSPLFSNTPLVAHSASGFH